MHEQTTQTPLPPSQCAHTRGHSADTQMKLRRRPTRRARHGALDGPSADPPRRAPSAGTNGLGFGGQPSKRRGQWRLPPPARPAAPPSPRSPRPPPPAKGHSPPSPRAASGRCVLTAAVAGVPCGVVAVVAGPGAWRTGGLRVLLPSLFRVQVIHSMSRRISVWVRPDCSPPPHCPGRPPPAPPLPHSRVPR